MLSQWNNGEHTYYAIYYKSDNEFIYNDDIAHLIKFKESNIY